MRHTAFTLFTLLFAASQALAQNSVMLQGTMVDQGKPLPGVSVDFQNASGRHLKVTTDARGQFMMMGLPTGDYVLSVTDAGGRDLYRKPTQISPSQATIDVDVAQSAGAQPTYTKEQVEALKKEQENAQATNALILQAQTAMNGKNWQAAVAPLEQLVQQDPGNWQYCSALGDAELNLGQYDRAVDTYRNGIQVAANAATNNPNAPANDPARKRAGVARMLTNEGNALLKLKRNQEAIDAFTEAASLGPNPAVAYFNLCATQYNTGNTDGALAACDKAIAADPTKADAYFIKGALMIAGSTTDAKGKVTAPPGTAEALRKYLALAPDGPHAKDVRDMLDYIGAKVETRYKHK